MSDRTPRFWSREGALRAIATAWLVAGTADLVGAIAYYDLRAGVSATRILQGIASGILGARAFVGGSRAAALGLVCHYLIALIWTLFFYAIYARIGMFAWRRWVTAVVYAIFVSLVMNLAVVPLSNVPTRPFSLSALVEATIILIFTIGFPLTAVIGGFYARRAREQ
jgi:hypothetical protein